jgi:hypothetical protein
MNKLSNETIEKVASRGVDDLLELLDGVKDWIADARNGSYSNEARVGAIEAIDTVLYNKVKNLKTVKKQEKGTDTYL